MTTATTPAHDVDVDVDRVLHVDPRQLAIASNARDTVDQRSPEFLALAASIRERGVLEPVHAYFDPAGALTVVRGQRRTLAAVTARKLTVPVLLVYPPSGANQLIDQVVENIHREAMTAAQMAAAVEQLAMFGVSESQIVRRTALPAATVTAALTVHRSRAAVAAAAAQPALDLTHLAGIAEFDDDPVAVTRLAQAATTGRFAHMLQELRDDRAAAAALAAWTDQQRAAGVTIVDDPGTSPAAACVRLSVLDGFAVHDTDAAAEHATCPGHAVYGVPVTVWFDLATGAELPQYARWQTEPAFDGAGAPLRPTRELRATFHAVPVCTDYVAHGHTRRTYTAAPGRAAAAPLTDAQRDERDRITRLNKQWRASSTVRRDWLFALVARTQPPAGAEGFVYRELLHTPSHVARSLTTHGVRGAGHQAFRDVMGLDRDAPGSAGSPSIRAELDELRTAAATLSPRRALLLTAAMLLCSWHQSTDEHTWQRPDDTDRRMLRQMIDWGYEHSEVEDLILDTTGDDA